MSGPHVCCLCWREVPELVAPRCSEHPERLKGAPIGMYHCPECGAMCIAGVNHPGICRDCLEVDHETA